jgi:hypothetical protein
MLLKDFTNKPRPVSKTALGLLLRASRELESTMRVFKNFTPSFMNATALSAVALLASSCGSQQYQNAATTQQVAAAGALQISPKVDVVLVEDDTGDMLVSGDDSGSAFAEVTTQVQNMLGSMASGGAGSWNYHFSTLRLTEVGQLTQATSSTQDPNWGSFWTAPYPGAYEGGYPSNEDALNPSIFTTFNETPGFGQYNGFVQTSNLNNSLEGAQPGLYSMAQNFKSSFSNTGFLRPDALLAVVIVSLANDNSYVNQCWNGNQQVPCDQILSNQCTTLPPVAGVTYAKGNAGACASGTLSLTTVENEMRQLKGSTQQLKIYSAVPLTNSYTSGSVCLGGHATPGPRYQQFAEDLGGQTYDVCNQPLSSILSDVAQNLTTTALDYITGYLLVGNATTNPNSGGVPNSSTIQVIKYPGGNTSNPEIIPQNATNGWTYVGFKSSQDTIILPVPSNYESGYFVQLNGSAQLSGSDTAAVTFKYQGAN